MKNESVFLALQQQQCEFMVMMGELRELASTLEGEELVNAMRQVGERYC